jgi:heme-degrading monooxygenase HmoA
MGIIMLADKKPENYYTVIFTLKTSGKEIHDFLSTLEELIEEAKTIDGFMGEEGIVDINGTTILLSYWRDEKSLKNWQENKTHKLARKKGKSSWFSAYEIRVGKVIKEYSNKNSGIST